MRIPPSRKNHLRQLLEILLTAVVYFFLAHYSLLLQYHATNATPVWPPSGLALAVLLLLGIRVAPGILLGAFVTNVTVFLSNKTANLSSAAILSSFIAIGNAAEALTGYYLLRSMIAGDTVRNLFLKTNNVFRLLLVAALMSIVSAFVGVVTLYSGKIISLEEGWRVWLTWWAGDASGVLMVTPLILAWAMALSERKISFAAYRKRILEILAAVMVLAIWGVITFSDWFPPGFILKRAFWMIPLLVWIASRFSLQDVTAAIVLCAIISVFGTLHRETGPFTRDQLNEQLLTIQTFACIATVVALALNVSVSERERTEASLRESGNQLEMRVKERTTQLSEKNTELERTNRELSSFSYIAGHDLQEPLRKIQMYSKRIIETELDHLSPDGRGYFDRMASAAERMQRLINDLLSYSRTTGNGQHLAPTDLNVLLEQVKLELREKITETGAVIEGDKLPVLNIIPFQFQQVFTNVISNSLKFARPGLPPHIHIAYHLANGSIGGQPELNGRKYHHIAFSDNGIGFEPEYNKKVFDLFQRLHSRNEYEGTGIGLAICKRVIENHQGFVTARGEPGKGATFNIYLPA